MAIAAAQPYRPRAAERGFALPERRAPQAGATSTTPSLSASAVPSASASSSSETGRSSGFPPMTVKALAAVLAVLGVIILAIALWRIIAWRKRRAARKSGSSASDKSYLDLERSGQNSASSAGTIVVEKPSKAFLPPPTPAPGVGWTPQIRSVGTNAPRPLPPAAAPLQKKSSLRSSSGSKSKWSKASLKLAPPAQRSPPPAYAQKQPGSAGSSSSVPPPPIPEGRRITPPPPTPLKSKFDPVSPVRTSSASLALARVGTAKSGVRLMTVGTTFEPSMDDELRVALGEVVRLLEEYEDEWCLVQRVGKANAARGVVPRFCLEERPAR